MSDFVATRAEVYAAIDSERDYQDAQKGNAQTDRTTVTVGEGVLLMEAYLEKAKAAFAGPHPKGREDALSIIRKITALGVLTLEFNGAPPRLVN